MPITIFPPIDNLFLGPGHVIQATSDNPTSLPGAYWTLDIVTTTTETFLSGASNRASPQSSTIFWVNLDVPATGAAIPAWPEVQPRAAAPTQAAVATVRLREPSGLVVEQTSTPVQWNPEPLGVAYVNSFQAQAQGGFLPADRSNLDLVLAAVRLVSPPALTGGANIVAQVIDLVRGPPRSFLRRFDQLLLSGRGTFSAKPPNAAHSFGGTWSFITVPAGYGRDDGSLIEYHRRLAQFVVVRDESTSDTYIDVLEDSHYEGNFILWQFPNPLQIQYDIAPGVQVLWQWLV